MDAEELVGSFCIGNGRRKGLALVYYIYVRRYPTGEVT
jgi:hypothetical protein